MMMSRQTIVDLYSISHHLYEQCSGLHVPITLMVTTVNYGQRYLNLLVCHIRVGLQCVR